MIRLTLFALLCLGLSFVSAQKTCPETVPVVFGSGDLMPCDLETNPTGLSGDPACAYSDCVDDGIIGEDVGQRNAWCICANHSRLGYGDGIFWDCVTARCACPAILDGEVGGGCGIVPGDMANDAFIAPHPVAGDSGCDLDDGNDCFCLPTDPTEDEIGEWSWQCGLSNPFHSVQPYTADSANKLLLAGGACFWMIILLLV